MMFGVADYWAFVVAVIVFLAIPGVGNLAIITSTRHSKTSRSGYSARRKLAAWCFSFDVLLMFQQRFYGKAGGS